MYFLTLGLFYVQSTNKLYHKVVRFANEAMRLPDDSIDDIEELIEKINNSTNTYPYDGICVDIDAVADMNGDIVWGHNGKATYNDNIKLINIEEIKKYEKDRK